MRSLNLAHHHNEGMATEPLAQDMEDREGMVIVKVQIDQTPMVAVDMVEVMAVLLPHLMQALQ